MRDRHDIGRPAPRLTFEEYQQLHPHLGVMRGRIGDMRIDVDPAAGGTIANVSVHLAHVGSGDSIRPAIGIAAQGTDGNYTRLLVPYDTPDEVLHVDGEQDPDEVMQTVADGMELFREYLNLSPEDRARADTMPQRATDWMDTPRALAGALGIGYPQGDDMSYPVMDAYAAWRLTFPAQAK